MRGWRLIAAGVVLFWGWAFVASAIWAGENDDTWIAYVPLLVGAALTLAAAGAGLRDPQRRYERLPLWLAVATGGLELVGMVWGIADEATKGYAVPLSLALLLVPAVAATAFGARRFKRAPERVRPPVNVRLQRGWHEATKSWAVLGHNAGLLILPMTSYVLGTTGWIGAYLLAGTWAETTMARVALTGFITLVPATVLGTFLGTAFIAALNRRLDGQPATAADGLRVAWRRRGPVLRWSLVAAGFGAVLQALQQIKSEWALAPLMSALAGVAWGVLTVFVLPVLALEQVGMLDAARRAAGLARRRWGESVGGLGNLTVVGAVAGGVLGLLLVAPIALAATNPDARVIVAVAGFACFMLMISALSTATQVLSLALYRHASDRPAPPFTGEELQEALVPRRRLRRRP